MSFVLAVRPSEHLAKDQVQQPRRHAGIMTDRRSPLVSDPGPTSGTPQVMEPSSMRGELFQPREAVFHPRFQLRPCAAMLSGLGLVAEE